jgi:hemerythrin-like metal-binding protein
MTLVAAGILAALFSFPSGVIRAAGGWLSDKFGARVVMYWVLGASVVVSFLVIVPKMEIVSPGRGVLATDDGVVTAMDATSITVGETRYDLTEAPEALQAGDDQTLILPTKDIWQESVVQVGEHVTQRQLLARGVTRIYFQANVWVYAVLVILLGSIWGIGKAAVYKHIPDYFPNQVGVVGGMVGVLGGLGGFVCPIIFGYLLEGTGLWTSCWMFMFLVSAVCLIWMHRVVKGLTKYPKGFESRYADRSRVLPGDVLAPRLVWTEEYSVGVELMDRQHQRMISLINRLDEIIQKGGPFGEFGSVLDGVIDYTKTHFVAEEALLEEADYPDLKEHKEAHQLFVKQVHHLREDAKKGDPAVMRRLLVFLESWLVGHIVGIDKQYSSHLGDQPPASPTEAKAVGA